LNGFAAGDKARAASGAAIGRALHGARLNLRCDNAQN
jgi:hypothetical protein